MMHALHAFGTILYFAMLVCLSCYGLHRYWMIFLYYRHRKAFPKLQRRWKDLPPVTIQLPLYNEMYVAERLLEAVASLDYPKEKLQIQILDDSTDETTAIVARKVAERRKAGFSVDHICRAHRTGYKAGALEHGLRQATGEFIAIFDADFVPHPALLQQTIHYFTDPMVGMVQTRWGHLNDTFSLLTKVQSIFLDGHFLIEQTARSHSGRFFNFNGTAGLWRRSCIESSGGWQHDTLAEDLDLSYRAQINGWKFLFLPAVVTPAELPLEMNAFKSQQHRWTKGSIQTCIKMLPCLWKSSVPWKIKFEGLVHLTSNFGHLMLFLMCLLFRAPAAKSVLSVSNGNPWATYLLVDLPIFLAATVSITAFYFCAQRELYADWRKRLFYVPVLMAIGVGLSVNNARAVLEGLFNRPSEFVRTPKFGVSNGRGVWATGKYRAFRGLAPYVEIGLGLYFSYLQWNAIKTGQWSTVPFVTVIQFGFLYVGLMSLFQGRPSAVNRSAAPALARAGA